MPRHTVTSVQLNPNVRARRVYPTEGTDRTMEQLQTVGIRLTRDDAIHLARILLAVTQDGPEVEITAKRLERRQSDGTFPVTVTAFIDDAAHDVDEVQQGA